jgi:hypothetical protein
MSYIANGCNDCSTLDFGGNQTNFLTSSQNGMFDNSSANQFMFQQPQQVQQPQMVQQQAPMVQVQQQAPMVQVQQAPMVPAQQPKVQVSVKPTQHYQAQAQPQQEKSHGIQSVITNYFMDNAFVLTIAFLVANAWHTTIKYYIDQAIKFNGGTPTYYVVYAVLATIVSIFLTSLKP